MVQVSAAYLYSETRFQVYGDLPDVIGIIVGHQGASTTPVVEGAVHFGGW